MPQANLIDFVNEQININAKKIIEKGNASDNIATGKLDFFTSLRAIVEGKASSKELGFIDAINDTLQYLQLLDAKKTFYK
jgi:hypothetical protein